MKRLLLFVLLSATACYADFEVEEDIPDELVPPMENDDLFEGDIEFDNEEDRSAAIKGDVKRWPNGVIYYSIDYSLNHLRDTISRAIWHIQNKTCLRYVEDSTKTSRIHMDAYADRCSSMLGRQGNKQALHLAFGCESFGTVVHEMLHASGLLHEHTRSDRDKYVRIEFNNIKSGSRHNFEKRPEGDVLLSDFDYDSIMMYRGTAFAKARGLKTIIPLQPGVVLKASFQKNSMTDKDAEGLKKLYNCP